MTAVAVQCERLTKRYGKDTALKECSLSIASNQVTGILGPNGSGKSTLFRIIAGLVRPDEGQIEVLGQSPGWKMNHQLAYLPDRARWYPEHTASDAFEWGRQVLPGFRIDQAKKLAEWMEIDHGKRVKEMSRGQEARLMLVLCLAREVPLVVLDEPFAGIDVISREQIVEALIEHLSNREQTILISTHELYEVEGLFDYAVFLKNGQTVLADEADELRRKYGTMHDIFRKLYR
ncbi:ABC transporter ATP-binding protein [Thermoactinomyces sp. CICC 10523]|jgi:ABC-2 type transport system ATP-binding protein|uniref:ABC transporter ATP-binding protein n=1 Tax=Thermoactinomyces sp. CICC 10523 TaxID=2767428 RepID=UPI0018DD96F8|nr:ABC transporter ATP-binding protein [Thermoactinomyces sp. CICC 10523]MBH8599234.1 ABC transporter ATP-binding protein [Thermoactinomyces sp. CICC 10523]